MVTVPPAESMVRLPLVVSISPAAVTPILIASAVTPAKVTLSVVPTACPIERLWVVPSPVVAAVEVMPVPPVIVAT